MKGGIQRSPTHFIHSRRRRKTKERRFNSNLIFLVWILILLFVPGCSEPVEIVFLRSIWCYTCQNLRFVQHDFDAEVSASATGSTPLLLMARRHYLRTSTAALFVPRRQLCVSTTSFVRCNGLSCRAFRAYDGGAK